MSTEGRAGSSPALVAVILMATLAVVISAGLLLREHGPGNMGNGLLTGAAVGLVGAGVMWWRTSRRSSEATLFERAWTQTGDERDDAVLTRALAVLGLVALPLTGAAAIAIGLGAAVEMVLTLLLLAEVAVGAAAFWAIDRRH
jgi:hypothetical protein